MVQEARAVPGAHRGDDVGRSRVEGKRAQVLDDHQVARRQGGLDLGPGRGLGRLDGQAGQHGVHRPGTGDRAHVPPQAVQRGRPLGRLDADPVPPAQAERDHAGRRHGRTVRAGLRAWCSPPSGSVATHGKAGIDHRGDRSGRVVPGRVPLVAGLHRHRHGAALQHGELRAHRPHSGPAGAGGRRPPRRGVADQHAPRPPAAGGLQPGCPVLRPDQLEPAGPDRRDDGHGRHPAARRHPPGRPRHPLLPGQLFGDVRQGARGPPEGVDALLPRAAPTAWPRCTGTGSR